MIAGGTIPGSKITNSGSHNHGITYGADPHTTTLTALAETTTCSTCGAGTNVIGGNCNGTNYTAMMVKSYVSGNSWCCDFYNTYNGGTSSFSVSANCLNAASIP